jgi:hypothetical protein
MTTRDFDTPKEHEEGRPSRPLTTLRVQPSRLCKALTATATPETPRKRHPTAMASQRPNKMHPRLVTPTRRSVPPSVPTQNPSTVLLKQTISSSLPARSEPGVELVSEKNPASEAPADLAATIPPPSPRGKSPKTKGGHKNSSESQTERRRSPSLPGLQSLSSPRRKPTRSPIIVPQAGLVTRISIQSTPGATNEVNPSLYEVFDVSDQILNDLGDTEETALNPAPTQGKDVSTVQGKPLMTRSTGEDGGKDVEGQISPSILVTTPEENKPVAQRATEPTQLPLSEMLEETARRIPVVVPEGHKLVHIMRHARAWHKYNR